MKFLALLAASLPAAIALSIPASNNRVEARQTPGKDWYHIHPGMDTTKCIGVLGGKFVLNAIVDIYDCNDSPTQQWSWTRPGGGLHVTDPVTKEDFCMDIHYEHDWTEIGNGSKVILKRCERPGSEEGIPTQAWGKPDARNYNTIAQGLWSAEKGRMCLDLTDGSKENRNPLQVWRCNDDETKPWKNQIWTWGRWWE